MKLKKALIIAIFILLGFAVKAYSQPYDFDDFVTELGINNAAIDLSLFLNPLDYGNSIADALIANSITIRGLSPAGQVAVLNGGSSYQGFQMTSKRLFFYDKIQFQDFRASNGAIFNVASSTLSFGIGFFNLIDSQSLQDGGAIYALASSITFKGQGLDLSTVSFAGNQAGYEGGGIRAINSNIAMNLTLVDFSANSSGYGGGLSGGNSKINADNADIRFIKNAAGTDGGAIYAIGSSVFNFSNSTINFSTNAAQRGGGIYAEQSNFNFTNSRVFFDGNISLSGGALYAHDGSIARFINSDIAFTSNAAAGGGGAVYLDSGAQMSFQNGQVSFSSNSANVGGAIYVHSGANGLTFTNTAVNFFANKTSLGDGGAIYANSSNITFQNSLIVFDQNIAAMLPNDIFLTAATLNLLNSQTKMFGGIMAMSNSSISQNNGFWFLSGLNDLNRMSAFNVQNGSFTISNATFTYYGNSAVFALSNSTINFTASSASFFGNGKDISMTHFLFLADISKMEISDGLSAVDGVFLIDNSALSIGRNNDFQRINVFDLNNSSLTFVNGYALYRNGRAIKASASTITFNSSSGSFRDNINGNTADGGALFARNLSAYFEASSITFTNNKTQNNYSGGAIWTDYGNFHFSNSKIQFTSNAAMQSGGAIWAGNSSFDFSNAVVSFTSNSAFVRDGGAFYIARSTLTFAYGDISFADNRAVKDGGAMFIEDSFVSFTGADAKFSGNRAAHYGGAVYLNRSFMEFNFNDASFINNAAALGGAVYINASTLSFSNAPDSQMFIDFSNNGVDIEFAAAASALIFTVDGGTIDLRNALRTQGDVSAKIIKQGGGSLIFSGQDTRLMNTFNINEGNVVFHSAKSSVSILSIVARTMLDMHGGGINAVFVEDIAPINRVVMGFDFDFANAQADFLHILNPNTPLDIQDAQVSVSIISSPTFAVSSLPFISAAAFAQSGIENLAILDAASHALYSLVLDNNMVWLTYREGWNYFVSEKFQMGQAGTTIYMANSITAGDDGNPLRFYEPSNRYGGFTVDGGGLVIDSSGTDILGFSLSGASLEFRDIHFTSFVHIGSNGAVLSAQDSHIDFVSDTSSITFSNNFTNVGAAIYIKSLSTLSFYGVGIGFINNSASYQGGVLYSDESAINFNSANVLFSNNSAESDGGVLYSKDSAINFNSASALFSNNRAERDGGAIFINTSQINLGGGSFVFENNNAQMQGGVFYLKASTLNFNANAAALEVLFKDNLAGGVSNDIYADSDSFIFLNSGNGAINFSNGIRIEAADGAAPIFKTGAGQVVFDGISGMKNDFDILQGRAIFKGSANIEGDMNIKTGAAAVFETTISSVSKINAEIGSALSMLGGGFDELWITSITLDRASFVLDVDFSRPCADRIFASSISIEASALIINEINRNSWVRKSSIAIIYADSPFYSDFIFNEVQFKIHHYDNMAVLQYVGFNPSVYDVLLKTALTHNQREAALMLGRIRNTKEGVNLTEEVLIKSSQQNIRRQLDILSASFLAATIIQASQRDSRDKLYPLINPLDKKSKSNAFTYENFWILASLDGISLNNKGNEIDWFKGFSREIAGGWNFVSNDGLMMGGFISAGSEKLMQDENKADIDNYEVGFYGGVFIPMVETRFFLTVGHHEAATERSLYMLGVSKTNADFNMTSVKAGIESAYDGFEIVKPYAGLRWALIYNEQVRENNYSSNQREALSALGIDDGANPNATIDRGAYRRLRGYVGIKQEKYFGRVLWHIKGELGYMFVGNGTDSEYEIHLADLGQKMDIWGLDVDPLVYGLGGGVDMNIRKNIDLFANAGFLRSMRADLTQMNVNVGVKFHFAKRIKKSLFTAEELSSDISDIDEAKDRRGRALGAYKLKAASFDFGSSSLSQGAKENIRKIAQEIKGNPYVKITVEGHTDSIGTIEANMAVSAQRAQAVANELIANGIDKEKVKVIGFAFKMPVADNTSAAGRMQNRRVEIFVE
jgi:predicted outer membrane repeat protein